MLAQPDVRIPTNEIQLLLFSTCCQVSELWLATRMAQCVCGTSSRETPSTPLKVRMVASLWRKKLNTQVYSAQVSNWPGAKFGSQPKILVVSHRNYVFEFDSPA